MYISQAEFSFVVVSIIMVATTHLDRLFDSVSGHRKRQCLREDGRIRVQLCRDLVCASTGCTLVCPIRSNFNRFSQIALLIFLDIRPPQTTTGVDSRLSIRDTAFAPYYINNLLIMKTARSTVLFLLLARASDAFAPRALQRMVGTNARRLQTPTSLQMGLDLVTYLRTEWISAALCTNQTPRSADVLLQLGVEDGRAVTFIPRTIRELITSSAEADGKLTVSARRQLKQQQERRKAATVTYVDQRCDDLAETNDESVDVVISLQASARMVENGVDWKKSIREAARVLKPGGRLLFVEQTELEGESYLEYIQSLYNLEGEIPEDADLRVPIFEVGFDDVDLVLVPHVAGVALKSDDAGLTPQELAKKEQDAERERRADLSIEAYERGIKKRRKKKSESVAKSSPTVKAK
jgi:SAM-dependent methyltransferase